MHRIRLGPPWEVRTIADGGTRHARKFGQPRQSDSSERIYLVCESVPAETEISLNELRLDSVRASGPVSFDITSLLKPRNVVVFSTLSQEPLGAVSLRIDAASPD